MRKYILLALLISSSARAEGVRPECQTEETRGLRFTSKMLNRATEQSMAPYNCNGCSYSTAVYDSAKATSERFKAEATAALYKARALEAAKCPAEADEILEGIGHRTNNEKGIVAGIFSAAMKKNYARLADLKQWQVDHPQCKHVDWWRSFGATDGLGNRLSEPESSKEDFSGKFKGKAGQCSADGNGPSWRGTEESLEKNDPDKNDLIGKVNCANALQKVQAYNGWYADPKFCQLDLSQ